MDEMSEMQWQAGVKAAEAESPINPDAPSLPAITKLDLENPTDMGEEIISGVLYENCVAIVSAPSKAGKTFLMSELAIAIATGSDWLGWQCPQGRVLVLDGEMRLASLQNRYKRIAERLGADLSTVEQNIDAIIMRGHAEPMQKLAPYLIAEYGGKDYKAIIIDPAYPFMAGDENSAGDMKQFTNSVLQIAQSIPCAVIYTHHHSKGDKSTASPIDRASGSSVFGRSPDAALDLIQIEPPSDEIGNASDDCPAFRVSATLRDFDSPEPFNVWFRYPIHIVDSLGVLDGWQPCTPAKKGGKTSGERMHKQKEERIKKFDAICDDLLKDDPEAKITIDSISTAMRLDKRTCKNYADASQKYKRESLSNKCYIVPISI